MDVDSLQVVFAMDTDRMIRISLSLFTECSTTRFCDFSLPDMTLATHMSMNLSRYCTTLVSSASTGSQSPLSLLTDFFCLKLSCSLFPSLDQLLRLHLKPHSCPTAAFVSHGRIDPPRSHTLHGVSLPRYVVEISRCCPVSVTGFRLVCGRQWQWY